MKVTCSRISLVELCDFLVDIEGGVHPVVQVPSRGSRRRRSARGRHPLALDLVRRNQNQDYVKLCKDRAATFIL